MSRKKNKNKGKGRGGKSSAKSTPNRMSSRSALPQPIPKFSLADEARWVLNHRSSAYETSRKLRHLPVQFVSAGHLEGTIKKRLAHPSPLLPPEATQDNVDAMAHMAIRSPSPVPSETSSSLDEVVFTGRVQTKPHWESKTIPWQHRSKPDIGWLPAPARPSTASAACSGRGLRDTALHDYMQNVEACDVGAAEDGSIHFANRILSLDASEPNDWESASDMEQERKDEDDDDHYGNHNDDDEEEEEEEEEDDDDEDDGVEDDELENNLFDDDWESDMLQDFDGLSTSSDTADPVKQILSKRMRPSGVHYLCVHEGATIDDARWLPASSLERNGESELVRAFEDAAQKRAKATCSSNDDEDDDDDDDDDNDYYYDDDTEDEEDAIDMDTEYGLDDETIARVLQKQEELGLGSEEVLLHGADEYFNTYTATGGLSRDFGGQQQRRQMSSKGRRRDHSFPSASALADALAMDPYDGFDIMDTERPSLKKKKGRRGQLPPEIADSDLNEQLQQAWTADRAKKRLKKAEREELRQQGLLGRKGKSADLKMKYKSGIVIEDVVEEIREFLLGDHQSLSLPPMEAYRRATVHQIATFFDLSSKSRGHGHERFTIVSKTLRTRILDDDEFERAVQSKGFRQRLRGSLHDKQHKSSMKGTPFRSEKHSRPRAAYHDGDTVGANAPELGPENKGHALMMKMGWSKGMALGTLDNQGILHPIAHKIKATKAGLQ